MRRKALPLDSPDWMPIAEAHRLLCSLTGSRDLAAKDLTDAMADEDEDRRVPAMRRCFTYGIRRKADGSHERVLVGPERELLPREYWIEHEVQSWSDATFVTRRSTTPAAIKGYAYFVWKPALAKIWPAAFALAAGPAAPRVRRTNDKRQHKGSPAQDAIRQIAAQEWPDGHEGIPIKHIIASVSPKLRARGIPVPKRDTWLRALGRRKS